jgi:hypothetical protein
MVRTLEGRSVTGNGRAFSFIPAVPRAIPEPFYYMVMAWVIFCQAEVWLVIQIVPELSKRLPAQRTGGIYKTQSQQGWPGRPILEYDLWIQGCEGHGPNFDFFY